MFGLGLALRVPLILALAISVSLLALPITSVAVQNQDRAMHGCLNTELVMLTITVTDANGNAVTDLTLHDFILTDNKKPQQVAFFSREDRPCSVGIVLSRSLVNKDAASIGSIIRSILRFKEQAHPLNEYFIVAAGRYPDLVTDWTLDNDALMDELSRVPSTDTEDGSAIYDSCAFAHEKLGERETVNSIIILISDGQDTASRLTYTVLRESFRRSNARVYSVSVADPRVPTTSPAQGGLKRLSAVSGGAADLVSSPNKIIEFLEQTAAELRHHYVLGYYPDDVKRDGSWHRVRVMTRKLSGGSLDRGPMVVRCLSGYNAPNEPRLSQH